MFFDMLPRFEPILRPTIKKMKVEAFCIDSLQRYLGAVARAFAIREAQLTGDDASPVSFGTATPLKVPADVSPLAELLARSFAEKINRHTTAVANEVKRLIRLGDERGCFDKRSPLERKMIDAVVRTYVRRVHVEKRKCQLYTLAGSVFLEGKRKFRNVPFRSKVSLYNAVRYDLEHYYDMTVEVAKVRMDEKRAHLHF